MRKLYLAVTGLTLALTIAGCSSSDDKKDTATVTATATRAASAAATSTASPVASAAAATTAPSGAAQSINLKAGERGDQFFFEPATFTVAPGKITVQLANDGPDRQHTFSLRNKAGDEIASINPVDPGKTGTVEFTLNEEGSFEFICRIRGHSDRGQKGTITVKK